MTFLDYLSSKKIDARLFSQSEPAVFKEWEGEFNQMHPNSFTVQKLNLINPIRRRYPAAQLEETPPKTEPLSTAPEKSTPPSASPTAKPQVPRPMMKPKPKMN